MQIHTALEIKTLPSYVHHKYMDTVLSRSPCLVQLPIHKYLSSNYFVLSWELLSNIVKNNAGFIHHTLYINIEVMNSKATVRFSKHRLMRY